MSIIKKTKRTLGTGFAILILILAYLLKFWMDSQDGGQSDQTSQKRSEKTTATQNTSPTGQQDSPTSSSAEIRKVGQFTVYENCRLVPNKYNDGDSFLVKLPNGEEREYRLYYVDTPESRDKPYDDHRERVRKQGNYFGNLDYHTTLEIGRAAKKFTKNIVGSKPFSVWTTGEVVYQGPRQYAYIKVNHQGKERWLHELLTENGLSRIHTKGAKMPNGTSYSQRKRELKKLERAAQNSGQGAWGY